MGKGLPTAVVTVSNKDTNRIIKKDMRRVKVLTRLAPCLRLRVSLVKDHRVER
jgi:hypothetical protein